jgi:hypothetical protein
MLSVRAFFSPRDYQRGPAAITGAGAYLAFATLFIVSAVTEFQEAGTDDGGFLWGFALIATLPLSLVVMETYSAIATTRGVPLSAQDGGLWTLPAFALCALVNALLLWVLFRGPRIRADRADQAQ